ncbi:hypothetical protein AB4Y40_41665 [Paraburkholderia sp. EG287B]|uniref:hypothetical protein n=1 Tax=Paraburkholderia sp. EG287B TaxID=3237010 RepID=UPI0034D1E880
MIDRWFAIETSPDSITAFANSDSAQDLEAAPKQRYMSIVKANAVQRARDVGAKDGVVVASGLLGDESLRVGAVSDVSIERSRERDRLISLIGQMNSDGYSCTCDRSSKISNESAAAARALFEILLPSHEVPKVAPDGEGGLIAVWDDPGNSTVLVVDNWTLHLVVNATTPEARYFDDVHFDGERLPDALIGSIPS